MIEKHPGVLIEDTLAGRTLTVTVPAIDGVGSVVIEIPFDGSGAPGRASTRYAHGVRTGIEG